MINSIIGHRYKSLLDIAKDIEKETNRKVVSIFESESEQLNECDFMIDYELENDSNVYSLFYLRDNQGNFFITEF